MLKQMSTEDIDIKKRKRWCDNSDSNRKKRNRRQSNRIYQIKAVAISPGYYHAAVCMFMPYDLYREQI